MTWVSYTSVHMDYRFSLRSMVLPHVTRNVAQNTRPSSTFLGTSQYCATWFLPLLTPCRCIFVLIPTAEHIAADHHRTHWTSLPLSHDLPTHATSHAPVECQISITFLFPLQSPSCFPQPWSQCPLWSGEDGSGNYSTVANHVQISLVPKPSTHVKRVWCSEQHFLSHRVGLIPDLRSPITLQWM